MGGILYEFLRGVLKNIVDVVFDGNFFFIFEIIEIFKNVCFVGKVKSIIIVKGF